MFQRIAINPKFAALVKAFGLDNFHRVMQDTSGQVMGGHRTRHVVRWELATAGATRTIYVKRDLSTHWKDLAGPILSGQGFMTKARREWEVLTALRARGILCPEPMVFAQRGLLWPQGYLVLAALPGEALAHWVEKPPWVRDRRFRRRVIAAVTEAVAKLHEAGFDQPDLYSKHIWLCPREGQWQVYLVDFQRSRRYRYVPLRKRWRDLAALDASIGPHWVTRSERRFFLDRYLQATDLLKHQRQAVQFIRSRALHLQSRRKIRAFRQGHTPDPQGAQKLLRIDQGRMWIDRHYEGALQQAGLGSVEAVMQSAPGTLLRRLPDRENWRLVLPGNPDGSGSVAYLKRHRVRRLVPWFSRKRNQRGALSAGCLEAENVLALERRGIRSMRLIAYGEQLRPLGRVESFLLTEAVADAVPLDDYLRQRFGPAAQPAHARGERAAAEENSGTPALRDLLALIDTVADLARRFHEMGYNHRDFYCCHFLVREPVQTTTGHGQADSPAHALPKRSPPDDDSRFEIHLIDLQRMQYRRRFRMRWIVKDLAQLSYSAPPQVIHATHRLRFFKRYLGIGRLGPGEKRLARRILAKHARIAQRGIAP